LHYGWQLPKGFIDREERNPLNFTLAQWQRAKRLPEDPKHEKRWEQESLQRAQRLPKGLKGIWHRITGKYQKIRNQNERETKQCRMRDRYEKRRLIDRQLKERQNLQRQVQPMIQEHKLQVLQLKQDVAGYIEMGGPSQKTRQEEFGQVQKNRDIDFTP
jgi:putative protein kinase ArgK-like GTPase of G3E family